MLAQMKSQDLNDGKGIIAPDQLTSIIDNYEALIIDVWGVLHNGLKPYPDVIEFLKHLKQENKNIIFVSNAPRRSHVVVSRMLEMGFTVDLFDQVLTAGEAAYLSLKNRSDEWHKQLGTKLYHIGADHDFSVFADLEGYTKVDALSDAEFIINTGTKSFTMTLQDYIPMLDQALMQSLPMICANPDKIVVIGDEMPACAGALAHYYEKNGGQVMYHGKPFTPIYQMALRLLREKNPELLHSDILCIGDSLDTDVMGAQSMEFDTLWIVETGVHGKEVQIPAQGLSFLDRCTHVCEKHNIFPNYVFPTLSLETL